MRFNNKNVDSHHFT